MRWVTSGVTVTRCPQHVTRPLHTLRSQHCKSQYHVSRPNKRSAHDLEPPGRQGAPDNSRYRSPPLARLGTCRIDSCTEHVTEPASRHARQDDQKHRLYSHMRHQRANLQRDAGHYTPSAVRLRTVWRSEFWDTPNPITPGFALRHHQRVWAVGRISL